MPICSAGLEGWSPPNYPPFSEYPEVFSFIINDLVIIRVAKVNLAKSAVSRGIYSELSLALLA